MLLLLLLLQAFLTHATHSCFTVHAHLAACVMALQSGTEQCWSDQHLNVSFCVCLSTLVRVSTQRSVCQSVCLQPVCKSSASTSVQASDRYAHPAVPGIDLSLWVIVQIFLLDMEGGYRGHASGQRWHEDLQWALRLDEGWNLTAVKQVSCPSCQDTCIPDPCTCPHKGTHCISSEVQRIFASCTFS